MSAEPQQIWKADLASDGLGGIAANEKYVLVSYRDFDDFQDVYQCFDAATGKSLWMLEYLAIGALDYGQSSRTTPNLVGEVAILLGAMGDLHCVKLADGAVVWKTNLRSQFSVAAELPWGYCGSPLVIGDKVIVQAGGAEASLVAFNLGDGSVAWSSPGAAPSYGSLIVAQLGGKRQIVGHDVDSLGGWDAETGRRLWKLKPPLDGDFNVPTPLVVDDKLLIVTENNGARLFAFNADGAIQPTPVLENQKLTPDMSSPVVVGHKVFCVDKFLYCLDLKNNLNETYRQRDAALGDYGAIIADQDRLLVIGNGDLLLVDAKADKFTLLSRQKFSQEKTEIFSHPALVGDRLYLRDEATIYCWSLAN
ncbi:PQQ-binding-like beta-propeller repeat protein [Blastopirellula sp. JC732]|uniref:PQQ-binding-like beta-propeller repeat protein n=1 Tax=Blastopirellula sediminis TaxID=2894196 RepID=A0A9X1MH64_9BACT|nr:PQQ-like beta-propeller repeat protein [Blastopirellula sediminis]MCC9608229.1 PQQ-binding-like beta-propeller repeat protein [Blastopirellula sediminis]MCC9626978.1 PQQ-binding-like beta-propeller repeat protein [Blastopirellula sediminis]